MSERTRLPNRRQSETFDLTAQGLKFTCTISRFLTARWAKYSCRTIRPVLWPASTRRTPPLSAH